MRACPPRCLRRWAVPVLVVGLAAAGAVLPSVTPTAAAGTTVVLVGAGDIADCDVQGDEATAALVEAIDGQVFTLGDLVYDGGLVGDFERCYGPSWGAFKDRTRPVIGNHEYAVPGASGYFDYFGSAAGDRDKGYYSYDIGSWHVVALNSNCGEVGGCGVGSAQETWLRQDLAASGAACTVAMWHHPRFSSGGSGDATDTQPLWRALWDHGVELLLSGHDHDYERFRGLDADGAADDATGVRQLVVGTGGRSHTKFVTTHAHSEVRNASTFGVLKLTLSESGYDWEFVAVPGSTFTDSGSGTCHDAPGSDPRPETTILAGPTATTSSTAAEFAFSSDQPGSTFTCALDEEAARACASPHAVSGLTEGDHRLTVTAANASGLEDRTPATWGWTVTPEPGPEPQPEPVTHRYRVSADAHVVKAGSGANRSYGSSAKVLVDGRPRTDGFLRFDVTGVEGTVTSATLRLWVTNPTGNAPSVWTTGTRWTERDLTWVNKPAALVRVANRGRVHEASWAEYDVTAGITSNGSHAFRLVPDSDNSMTFTSREGTARHRPKLVLVSE